jgi:cytochrome c-type biogenesis protein CcmH
MKYFFLFFFIFCFEIKAIEPDEILENKELEKIAKEIGKELRCLVCQNEDIENSNADIAKDLRLLVRKKLSLGESKKEIIDFIHSKYGDFILFSPPIRIDTAGLWALPIFFFIIITCLFFRQKR